MNTMEQALANAKPGNQGSPAKPPSQQPPAARLTSADVRARYMARLMGKAGTTVVIGDNDVTLYVDISEELKRLERKLEPLNKKHQTLSATEVNRTRTEIEQSIRECGEGLETLSREFPGIVVKAAERDDLRAYARNSMRTLADLDPANNDEDAVKKFLKNAVDNGTIKEDGTLYAATVEDPVLQELEGRVNDFLKAVKAAREEERQKRAANVEDYLMNPAEEKAKSGKVSLTKLLAGEGQRAFVPVHGTKRNSAGDSTGEEYFMGEALVEQVNGKPVVTKASRVRPCEIFFFQYDRSNNTLREKGVITLPSDIAKVQPNLLREALQRQLMKDGESADRREKANMLSTVANYPDAVTYNEFRYGGKPSRWIGNGEWTAEGRQRPSHVTLHALSDGKQFHIADAACDLKEVDEAFFGMYMEPKPLSALSSDKRWLAYAANSRPFECDWELRKAASKHTNVIFITKENSVEVEHLFGVNGTDGVYAAIARWKQETHEKSDAPKFVAIGYLIERRGEKVAFTYATSGTAAGIIEKEQDAYPVSDLPLMTKAVARQIWMAAKRDAGTVPDHLKPVAKSVDPAGK